jgi:hypothetical protein
MVAFPCLRCGRPGVPVATLLYLLGAYASAFDCRLCDAKHYFSVERDKGRFVFCYTRYTLRYPLESYEEGEAPIDIRVYASAKTESEVETDAFSGAIVICPRKKRFSSAEIQNIWKASKGRCHICRRSWPISKRGRLGWHVDHLIPHIGGGVDAEALANFRVACAKCNLKKGRGYTEAMIQLSLRTFVEALSERRRRRV